MPNLWGTSFAGFLTFLTLTSLKLVCGIIFLKQEERGLEVKVDLLASQGFWPEFSMEMRLHMI